MDASTIFENLLQQIQNSQLNFKLELSPFSANISLKKSFVRTRSGNLLPRSLSNLYPCEDSKDVRIENYEAKIKLLELQVNQLQFEKENLTKNYDEEIVESEALTKKLKNTLERLENI